MDKVRITEPKHSTVCDKTVGSKLTVMQLLSKFPGIDKMKLDETDRNVASLPSFIE